MTKLTRELGLENELVQLRDLCVELSSRITSYRLLDGIGIRHTTLRINNRILATSSNRLFRSLDVV